MKRLFTILFETIRRWGSSRGFGVQSPFAFSFLHDVIRQKIPYYAYESLKAERLEEESANSRKVDELLFRLTNFVQPVHVILPFEGWKVSQKYITEACRKAHIHDYGNADDLQVLLPTLPSVEMVCLQSMDDVFRNQSQIFGNLSDNGLIVIKNINQDIAQWKEMLTDERITVSFDLYGLGLLIFRKNTTQGRYLASIFD